MNNYLLTSNEIFEATLMNKENMSEQSQDEKRQLRRQYRELLANTELEGDQLLHSVRKANELFSHVQATQEATLDSKFLLQAAYIASERARTLQLNGGLFEMDEFIGKLKQTMDSPSGLLWASLTKIVSVSNHMAQVSGSMFGPLSIQPKPRTVRKTHRLVKDMSKLQNATELSEKDIQGQPNETSVSVLRVFQILQENEPIGLFEFFVDPNSFGNSVENLFHISFLLKDARVAIQFEEEEGQLIIQTIDEDEEMDPEMNKSAVQNMFEFDHDMWQRAVRDYDLKTPVIPPVVLGKQSSNSNTWYG